MTRRTAPNGHRCQAWTAEHWWHHSERCGAQKKIRVNEKELCIKHARIEALSLLVNGERVHVDVIVRTPHELAGVLTKKPQPEGRKP